MRELHIIVLPLVLLSTALLPPTRAHAQGTPGVADGESATDYETGVATPADFDIVASVADGEPLSAEQAVAQAISTSPSLERARALADAAEAGVSRARTAMYPRLDVSAMYMHVDGFQDGVIPLQANPDGIAAQRQLAAMVSDPAAQALWGFQIDATEAASGVTIPVPRDRLNFGARVSWPVSDFFFAILPTVDAAEAAARVRVYEQATAVAGVRRSANEAYLTLIRARGTHAVAIEAERQAESRVEEIAAGVQAGFLTESDELAAQSRLAEAARMVATAMAGVEVADAALRTLIGADDNPEGVVYGVHLDEDAPPTVSYEDALENRPELQALREVLEAQRAQQSAAEAAGYPHLSVWVGGDVGNPNRYQVPPTQEFMPSWEVGASLAWSPNDTVSALRHGDQLSAEQIATEAQIENVQRMIRLELRQAQAELRSAQRSLEAAEASVTAANSAYESRLSQLRAGGTTPTEVYDTERQLNRARLAELDAHIQVQLAAVHLRYAAGEL